MSGPIVRKYGFPNFDKIFGEDPFSTESTMPPSKATYARQPRDRKTEEKDLSHAESPQTQEVIASK